MVSEEITSPVGPIFADLCERHELGVGLDHALTEAAELSGNNDMKIFAASVAMQIESGGNLAELIQRVANVIRTRIKLARKARVLTAEINLSKYVLLALPVAMFLIVSIINPDYMTPLLTTFAGNVMILSCCVSMFCGWVVMNRMSNLKY